MKITATVLLALLTVTGPVQAHIVSKKVGPLLQQAKMLIEAKDYQGAAATLNEAEAVKANPDDEIVINQFRDAIIASASSDPTQPRCTRSAEITGCAGPQAIGPQP